MPKKKGEIACILGIILCALFLRMYAFTYLPRRPVTDDAYEHNYIAQNIANAIKGKQLEDKDKFLYFGAKRGWLYPLFIATVYKLFGPHVLYVRLIQIVIDSLTCVLIYLIGRTIFQRKVGIVAALLSSLYPGFVYYSIMLYQETTTIFLLALYLVFLCKAISHKKLSLYFTSGILLSIISFYRSGFIFFPLLAIPALFLILQLLYKKGFLRYFLHFLTGSVSMLIIYGTFSYAISGTFTFNKPPSSWIFYETIHRDGWVTDTYAPTPTKELNEIAKEYSYPISPGNQAQKFPPETYIKAGIQYIRKQPFEYLSQFVKRVKRVWTYVETYPGRWHSSKVWSQLLFHRFLILLGLLGISLSLTVWHHSWLFYLIFLYITCVYTPVIGIPRYAVIAMPFIIILAVYALFSLMEILKNKGKQLIFSKPFLLWIATVVISAILYYMGVPMLLALFPQVSPPFFYTATILLMNLILIAIGCLGYHVLNLRFENISRSFYITAFPLVIVMVFYNNEALTSKTWHGWEAPLYSHQQKIKQLILLPQDLNLDGYRKANIMIDMFPGGGKEYNFHMKVNGRQIKVYQGGIKVREQKFDNKFFGFYKSFFFETYELSPEDLRQWYEIPLPLHFLKKNSTLVVECYLTGTVEHKKNYVIVFGDYTTSIDENFFEGPCFPRSDLDTALGKIMPYSGDYRFERTTPLSSKKTISEYYNGLQWQHDDLSNLRGVQSGSYRIRVELIGKNGSQVIL